jgi:hypothetical protein
MPFVNIHGKPIDQAIWLKAQAEQAMRSDPSMAPAKSKPIRKNGYAAPPGTGPEGMTCKQCQHKHSFGGPNSSSKKTFIKCELRRDTWTNGEGTDILARTPACSKFEQKEQA